MASDFNTPGLTSNLTPFIPGNGYEYYVMTSPGNVTITKSLTIDVLCVGGGGGTATYPGPSPFTGGYVHFWRTGGGGGGVVRNSSVPVNAGSYPVTVGSGGSGNSVEVIRLLWSYRLPGGSVVHQVPQLLVVPVVVMEPRVMVEMEHKSQVSTPSMLD